MVGSFFSTVLLLFTLLVATAVAHKEAISSLSVERKCAYSLFVRTGDRPKSGTNSKINVTLVDSHGESFVIHDLVKFGLMEPGHNYLENGNTDFFSVKGKCLTNPICKLILNSNGSGRSPSWFVVYLKVVQNEANVPCFESTFNIGKWIGSDYHNDGGYGVVKGGGGIKHAPFELVVTLDECVKRARHSKRIDHSH